MQPSEKIVSLECSENRNIVDGKKFTPFMISGSVEVALHILIIQRLFQYTDLPSLMKIHKKN